MSRIIRDRENQMKKSIEEQVSSFRTKFIETPGFY